MMIDQRRLHETSIATVYLLEIARVIRYSDPVSVSSNNDTLMSDYHIHGGRPLIGSVQLSGAKNAASKILLASLLTDQRCVISNVPAIGELDIAVDILCSAGAAVQRNDHTVTIDAAAVSGEHVSEQSRRNRLSVLAIGPLLHRSGFARVPTVSGDKIGARPVNFHIAALRAFGATVDEQPDALVVHAKQLTGAAIDLPWPTVGATETVLLTSVLARGITTLTNAAVEPEIRDLIRFLQKMGAQIRFTGDRTLEIQGVESLHGTEHRVIPDRLEAASFAAAALATGGDVKLLGTTQDDCMAFLSAVKALGAGVDIHDDSIHVWRDRPLTAIDIRTDVYPGFATDWQQPLAVALTQAVGESTIHETIYEDRLGYLADLRRMGANLTTQTDCLGAPCRFHSTNAYHAARITGPTPLVATTLIIPDIRAGMAHVIGALSAQGDSVVKQVEILDRGYERLEEKLRALGAEIVRVDEDATA